MSKRVVKLFAVVGLISGCELADGPPIARPAAHAKAQPPAPAPAPAPPGMAVATPRTLPSGRPACGNVTSRAPARPECEGSTP